MTYSQHELDPIITAIDRFFIGTDYSDPDSVSGEIVAARARTNCATEDETGDQWTIADILMVIEVNGEPTNTRAISLGRTSLDGQQIWFEYAAQAESITPSGDIDEYSTDQLIDLFKKGFELATTK